MARRTQATFKRNEDRRLQIEFLRIFNRHSSITLESLGGFFRPSGEASQECHFSPVSSEVAFFSQSNMNHLFQKLAEAFLPLRNRTFAMLYGAQTIRAVKRKRSLVVVVR